MQRVRGLIAGFVVGTPLAVFMWFWLHATREAAGLSGALVGLAIFAVVATRSDARDAAADVAWREVAADLPPNSERAALERVQAEMPGPDRALRATSVAPVKPAPAKSRTAAKKGSEPK